MSGHLNPTTTLARSLRLRGHRVTLFGRLDARDKALAMELEFAAWGQERYPRGSIATLLEQVGRLDGVRALALTMRELKQVSSVFLAQGPQLLRRAQLDLLVVDETFLAADAVAEAMRLPIVTICNALALVPDPSHPPVAFGWKYRSGRLSRWRNRALTWVFERLGRSLMRELRRYRVAHGLPAAPDARARTTIAQQPAFFDFPRLSPPAGFHQTGPFHDLSSRDSCEFPFDRLDGRPLVYASLGTVQNRQAWIIRVIAEACAELRVQLCITLGRNDARLQQQLPGSPLVVPYAPQRQLLQRAALFITHAGLNSALEALSVGVPMAALPITNDQPAVASRLARLGVAEVVPLSALRPETLRRACRKVLELPSYRAAACAARERIVALDGLERAADIVERVATQASRGHR